MYFIRFVVNITKESIALLRIIGAVVSYVDQNLPLIMRRLVRYVATTAIDPSRYKRCYSNVICYESQLYKLIISRSVAG